MTQPFRERLGRKKRGKNKLNPIHHGRESVNELVCLSGKSGNSRRREPCRPVEEERNGFRKSAGACRMWGSWAGGGNCRDSGSTAFAFGVSRLPRGRGPIPRGRGPGAPALLVALTPPLSPDSRYILLPVVLRHLHMHLQEQKDLIMCARILSNVFCLIKKNSSVSKQRPSRVAPIQRLLEIKCSMSAE